jgi:hypothetical protein
MLFTTFRQPLEIHSLGKVAVLMGDNSPGISVPDAEVVKITFRLGAQGFGTDTVRKGAGSEARAGPRRELQFIPAGCWFQLGPQADVQ